jgi:hypothetical protein
MRQSQPSLYERIAASEAAASGLLALANAVYFGALAGASASRGRRGAAWALVLVNAALALESALYVLLFAPGPSGAAPVAAFAARTSVLVAVATLSALIWRRESARRRR